MSDLTDRQREIFTLIYESARDKGFQPTIRELMVCFGIKSPNGVMYHVKEFRKKGYLKDADGQYSRAYVILKRPDGTPFLGFQDKAG